MNRLLRLLPLLALALLLLPPPPAPAEEPAPDPTPLKVVVTIFPAWDWTREILGDRASSVELTLLQDTGTDLHSYTPTAAHLRTIADSDLFIFVGGESDRWARTLPATDRGGRPPRIDVDLLHALGDAAKPERLEPGMEGAPDGAPDEHVWLSLRLAQRLVDAIAGALAAADPANAAAYRRNAAAYNARLAALDADYAAAFAAAPRHTLLFADRFPFRYLADDYGLDCIAAFPGCSSESEASFRTIATLARKIDELGLTSICVLENSSTRLAETVRAATLFRNQTIVHLDSMQTLPRDWRNDSYFATMHVNLDYILHTLE